MATVFEYKEIVGVSTSSIEDAIKNGVAMVAAEATVAWFEILSIRGRLVDADTLEYQVTVKVGCKTS